MLTKRTLVGAGFVVAAATAAMAGTYWTAASAPQKSATPTLSAHTLLTAMATSPVRQAASMHLADIDQGLVAEMQKAGAKGIQGAFVHFSDTDKAAQDSLLKGLGLRADHDFRQFADSVYVTGTVESLLSVATATNVYRLEWNQPMKYYNHTANWAIRTRVAQERVMDGPYYDALNRILDGTGVGVAVIDSGLDGTHGDFNEALNGGRNYKAVCAPALNPCVGSFVDVGTTGTSDTSSGHGHHVAGTVLGNGSRSMVKYPIAADAPFIKGSFAGVAPKAKLYAYGTGEAVSILFHTMSYNHILTNYENRTVFPTPIRVTNNSYGNAGGSAYNPTDTLTQLVNRAVNEKGITVVFAAGNDGDGTTVDKTSSSCKNPTPGVICVASYDDLGTGSLNGVLSDFTGQGDFAASKTHEYPDIAAPGHNILSTCTAALPICKDTGGGDTAFLPFYGTISGTSMAAPHVVGAIALMLQARPDLTPAQIEDTLQDNARKIVDNTYGAAQAAYQPDPQNPGGTINYRAGAGLLDFPRTLDALGVAKFGSLPAAIEHTIISGDQAATGGADAGSVNAFAANDLVKLTMQDEVKGGNTGITFRITVADGADLGGASFIRYQVLYNVDGRGYSTAVTLRSTGVTAEGKSANTNAPATVVGRTGNVISFFVPLSNLGNPSVGTPVHNIRMNARSDANGNEAEVDYAPSRTADVDSQSTAPGWGKPYTIVTALQGTPVVENRCEVPGVTVLNDNGGDSLTTDNQDLLSASVAQPFAASGNPNLVFTIKVASLATLSPGSGYYVSFNTPAGFRGVRMSVVNPAAPTFITYTPSANNSGGVDGRFVGANAPAAAGSNYNAATGVITIVATPASIGLTAAGQSLTGFNGGVTQSSDPGVGVGGVTAISDEMPDGLGRAGSFTFLPNAFCAPNEPPVAVLTATPNPQGKGLDVRLRGVQSSDPNGDAIVEYTFDYGDGSQPVSGTDAFRDRSYPTSGSRTVTLKVKDARGLESAPVSVQVQITNATPTVELAADKTSGTAPSTVNFTATGSDGDAIDVAGLLYSYDLNGDGSFEIVDSASTAQSFTYNTPGTYTARVQIKDSEGAVSVDEVVITVTEAVQEFAGISFVERFNVPISTFITSERKTVTGFTGSLPVEADADTQYSIDGGPFTSAAGSIRAGQTIAIRHVSQPTEDTRKETLITIGGKPAKLITTTTVLDHDPNDLVDFATQTGVVGGRVITSATQAPIEYDDAPISAGPGVEYRINSGAWTKATGKAKKGDVLQMRHTSNAKALGYTKTYIRVGPRVAYFVTRTKQ